MRVWIFLLVPVIALGAFLLVKPDVAYGVRDIISIAIVFGRVDIEILQPTPYGRYYHELYFKHFDELGRILDENPSYRIEMAKLMRLYVPHAEAALEGRGQEVYITQAQVDELQAFVDEIQAAANEALQADIARELQRTPLQDFVGLNVDEVLEHIKTTWERDFPMTPEPPGTNSGIQAISPSPLPTSR